jgi:phosphoesterase RecJ-like protein
MTHPFSPELAHQIFDEIKKANKILMHCHPGPDGDSVGSTLAMKYALASLGKDADLIKGDSDIPQYLSILPGVDTIIKKNIYDVDLTQYDLFLILDAGGLNQISKIKDPVFPPNLTTIVIDHHKSNTGYATINLVDPSYPATTQIVFDLLKLWNIPLTKEIALNLLIGLYTDTGGFSYPTTTYKTFEAAAELSKVAPDYTDLIFHIQNSNTKGRLKLKGILLNTIEEYCEGSVALASISYEDLQKYEINAEDATGVFIANEMKSVVGWNVTAFMMESNPGIVKVSFRTRDMKKYDVSKLATAVGGGGHAGAAGAEIQGTLAEAKEKIVAAIKTLWNM